MILLVPINLHRIDTLLKHISMNVFATHLTFISLNWGFNAISMALLGIQTEAEQESKLQLGLTKENTLIINIKEKK